MSREVFTLVVCGGGLAGLMTANSLANGLGRKYRVVLVDGASGSRADALYGSVTAPTAYDFCRGLGLDEPTLFLQSATSFSFGTLYRNWPSTPESWVQCHHLPLPVISGVPLQHHLTRQGAALQPLLISAQAAIRGTFVHPPQDPKSPLSRAEYGYQFSVDEWDALLRQSLESSKTDRISGEIVDVESVGDQINLVRLNTGEEVKGDLFIDCTGPARHLMKAVGGDYRTERELEVARSTDHADELGPPYRTVETNERGWTSTTHLQNAVHTLTVSDVGGLTGIADTLAISLGRLEQPWRGNCLAIGHAAAILEPLTPAPMMLLQRDIERLMELIPVDGGQKVERKEFNRRFENDVTHASLFQSAFFRGDDLPGSAYWSEASKSARSAALDRKIAQFEHRGLLVKYDLEPFNDEDWMILYTGLGLRPSRYDRQLDRVAASETERNLAHIERAVQQMTSRMPRHHLYVTNMKKYLETRLDA